MQHIKCLTALSSFCSKSDDAELKSRLEPYEAAIEEFPDQFAAEILIIEGGDSLALAERTCGQRLVADGNLAFAPELIIRHEHWFEIVWIISDAGDGLALFVEVGKGTNQELLDACERALAQTSLP